MITEVKNRSDLEQFLRFAQTLYARNPYYVLPFFRAQIKELTEATEHLGYKALMCVKDAHVKGRILYVFQKHQKSKETVCYFSHFECVDSIWVARELFNAVFSDMKAHGIQYIEGPYCPYDPDARRGILLNCYDQMPSLFNTYNFSYYPGLLETLGFQKAVDTLCMHVDITDEVIKKSDGYGKFIRRSLPEIRCDYINFKQFDRDLEDVGKILASATSDINYQQAPDGQMIRAVAENLKLFLTRDFIVIARKQDTEEPVGFILVLKDFNPLLRRMNGRMNPFVFFAGKRSIRQARGMLQYVVPEYQSTGLIALMFDFVIRKFRKHRIESFEGGTIVEENIRSLSVFEHYGGALSKRYRIYGRKI